MLEATKSLKSKVIIVLPSPDRMEELTLFFSLQIRNGTPRPSGHGAKVQVLPLQQQRRPDPGAPDLARHPAPAPHPDAASRADQPRMDLREWAEQEDGRAQSESGCRRRLPAGPEADRLLRSNLSFGPTPANPIPVRRPDESGRTRSDLPAQNR